MLSLKREVRVALVAIAVLMTGVLALPTAGAAEEPNTVEEIVGILRDKGLIDEAQQQQLLARHARERARPTPSVGAKLSEGIEWTGDLRLRHETIWFDGNADGTPTKRDRYRARYRARLGFKKQVNEWARVGMRLVSGTVDSASTNRTLGTETSGEVGRDDDFDFGPDSIYIDRAWAEFALPSVAGIESRFVGGKFANPFMTKDFVDILIWDGDIQPEGAYLTSSLGLGEAAGLRATLGAFTVEERSSGADGMLYAAQLGGDAKLSQALRLGVRGTFYQWRNLDASIVARAVGDGNIAAQTFDSDGDVKIGEVAAFLALAGVEDWPVTLYGSFAHNLDARSLSPVHEEDDAWSFGLETGDKKKLARLGIGYFYAEANSLVANFVDSDVFDAKVNRKGVFLYGSRQLGDHVDFKVTYYDSDEISSSLTVDGADRKRLRTDLILKF